MNQKKFQIFVSSTFTDLAEVRRDVIEAIHRLQHFPVGMEQFSASDEEQWTIISETLKQTDYYICIVGFRYGSLMADGRSFTEREWDYAKELGIPIMSFVRERNAATRPSERDHDSMVIKKLDSFIGKIQKDKMVDFWKEPADLVGKVLTALHKAFAQNGRPGWQRIEPGQESKSASQSQAVYLSQHDKELVTEFRRLLPSDSPTLRFLREHDIAVPFKWDLLTPLRHFCDWDNADREFDNMELEKIRSELHNMVREFIEIVAYETSPAHFSSEHLTMDFKDIENRPEKRKAQKAMNELGTAVYEKHQELVRHGKTLIANTPPFLTQSKSDAELKSKTAENEALQRKIAENVTSMDSQFARFLARSGNEYSLLPLKELQGRALGMVSAIRIYLKENDDYLRRGLPSQAERWFNASQDEKIKLFEEDVIASRKASQRMITGYNEKFRAEAILLRNEMNSRIPIDQRPKTFGSHFENPVVASEITSVADDLDLLAKRLAL